MSRQKTLTSSDPKAITALVASCDVLPQATADPISLRCKLSISFAADDPRIEEAAAAYERGELTVNVGAYERAQRIVADVLRQAKQNAAPRDLDEAARVAVARERERNEAQAAQPSPYAAMQRIFQDAERRGAAARAASLSEKADRWQWSRADGPRPPAADNGDAETEEGGA